MMTGNDAVTDVEGRARSARKSATAYRTISEVSEELEVPQHVLRFWETKFSQVRPLKRGGGRRYYRPEDVQLLRRIQRLLYQEGYTIKGVQRLLREGGRKAGTPDGKREPVTQPTAQTTTVAPAAVESAAMATTAPATPQVQQSAALGPDLRRELEALLHELKSLRAILTGEEPS